MIVPHVGCGSGKGVPDNQPSYADLVVIYNAELDSLDRLERKRNELIASYEQQRRPDADRAVKALTDVLKSASEGKREDSSDEALDPEAALDRAIESAEKAQQVASQLLDAVGQPAQGEDGEDAAQQEAHAEEFKRQLAALDEQIEEQRERVERARQARDAAERE